MSALSRELLNALAAEKRGEKLSPDDALRVKGWHRSVEEHKERKRMMVMGLAPDIVRMEFEEGLNDFEIGKRLKPVRAKGTIIKWRRKYAEIFRQAYQAWAAYRQHQAELTAKQQETENLLAASELGPLMRQKLKELLANADGKLLLETIKYVESKISRDNRRGNVSLTMNFSPDTVNYLQSVLPGGRDIEGEVLGLETDNQREDADQGPAVGDVEA